MTLTLELESWSRESNAARSFLSLRSMMAICPTGFSAATASVEPLLHAKGQELGSPVQLAASDDLMRLKQLLHMTSRSSMSFAAPCARFGRSDEVEAVVAHDLQVLDVLRSALCEIRPHGVC